MTLKDLSQQLGTRLPERDDLLGWIGLQQRTANETAFTLIGAFALGTVGGGALALLFAPKPVHQLRHDRGERLDGATHRLKEQFSPPTAKSARTPKHGRCEGLGEPHQQGSGPRRRSWRSVARPASAAHATSGSARRRPSSAKESSTPG